jgi:Fur family ferric uptake transcriptional regulator
MVFILEAVFMSTKARYATKHFKQIANYLESMQGSHITAQDVCDHFRAEGHPISTTTVYRQLERLVDEGIVNKYIIDANTPACFEYSGNAVRGNSSEDCYHCKCEKCGALIHLHCDEISELCEHLSAEHHFLLDPKRTVFYGICERCAAAGI